MIGDVDGASQAGTTTFAAMFPEPHTATDTRAAGNRRVIAGLCVMRYLHLIVYLYTATDQGIGQRPAIDAGTGTDLDSLFEAAVGICHDQAVDRTSSCHRRPEHDRSGRRAGKKFAMDRCGKKCELGGPGCL